MSYKMIERLDRIHLLIVNRKTGTPSELSKKMRISERQIRNYIALLKKMGASIRYCGKCRTYYYSEEGTFNFHFDKH